MRTAIGIRVFDKPDPMFFQAFVKFLQNNKANMMLLPIVYGMSYDVAANMIAHHFIDSDADNLLFIDDDITFSCDDILKIKLDIEDIANKQYGMISGLYCSRRNQILPLAMRLKVKGDWTQGWYYTTKDMAGINHVDACGLGFTIIKRECFSLPIFRDGRYFKWGRDFSEDVGFCRDISDHGWWIGLDTDISLGHRANVTIKWNAKLDKPEIRTTDVWGQDL